MNPIEIEGEPSFLRKQKCSACGSALFPDEFESQTIKSSDSEIGIVYILIHVKGQNVKVGETKSNSADRLRDYSKVHSLKGFTWHKDYEVPLKARQDIEKRAHKILEAQGFGMSFGSAKEIFACTPEIAEVAVEKAISESDIARLERKKQRRREEERQRREKAEIEYDAKLETFTKERLGKWDSSPWVKSKKAALNKFVASNSFEKEGKRTFFNYCLLIVGWYFLICGVGFVLGTLRAIFDPIAGMNHLGQILLIGGAAAGCLWMGRLFTQDIVLPVPDDEALSKKAAMEEEIELKKEEQMKNAEAHFKNHFKLEDFYK